MLTRTVPRKFTTDDLDKLSVEERRHWLRIARQRWNRDRKTRKGARGEKP